MLLGMIGLYVMLLAFAIYILYRDRVVLVALNEYEKDLTTFSGRLSAIFERVVATRDIVRRLETGGEYRTVECTILATRKDGGSWPLFVREQVKPGYPVTCNVGTHVDLAPQVTLVVHDKTVVKNFSCKGRIHCSNHGGIRHPAILDTPALMPGETFVVTLEAVD